MVVGWERRRGPCALGLERSCLVSHTAPFPNSPTRYAPSAPIHSPTAISEVAIRSQALRSLDLTFFAECPRSPMSHCFTPPRSSAVYFESARHICHRRSPVVPDECACLVAEIEIHSDFPNDASTCLRLSSRFVSDHGLVPVPSVLVG